MDKINEIIDIKETCLSDIDKSILSLLLKDRSTGKNIIWATDTYVFRGKGYYPQDCISVNSLKKRFESVIKPRVKKSKDEQAARVKNKAEVFTPSWVCNEMLSHYDETSFGLKNAFNTSTETTWTVNKNKVPFSDTKGKTWRDYVKNTMLEITCGEAPFIVSRYDTVTGRTLNIYERVGALDRKLRIVSENTSSEKDWVEWAIKAYKSVYGYEWSGDSLFLARQNLLLTFVDHYVDRFEHYPIIEYLKEIAKIISWNLWQMDGLKNVVPYSCKPIPKMQISLFDNDEQIDACPGCITGNNDKHTGIYCKIMCANSKRTTLFLQGDKYMKFDFIIGNPPYNEASEGQKKADDAVYHYFMDASYGVGNKVMLITPARFLFNNGNTPEKWNRKMLEDPHFKVIRFEPIANKIFNGVGFKGGVAIHYRDMSANFGAIMQFTDFEELNSTLRKTLLSHAISLTTIMYNQNKFNLNILYSDYSELQTQISGDGRERRLTSGCLKFPCFHVERESEDDILILGVINNKRVKRYINRKYIEEPHQNLEKYKVIVPANNGSGAIGEVLSTPLVGEPLVGFTQTFISIGAFSTYKESENALKYVKSKYCRAMLGVLKVTQNGKREMWKYVPLQDFTDNSDIEWSKSVHEIDLQLYKKYGLDAREISFIETHVKEME